MPTTTLLLLCAWFLCATSYPVVYPFTTPHTITVHGGKPPLIQDVVIPMHIEDFGGGLLNPTTFHLHWCTKTEEQFCMNCVFPIQSASTNVHTNCTLKINSYIWPGTMTLTSIRIDDSHGAILSGGPFQRLTVLQALNKAIGNKTTHFTTTPAFHIAQAGVADHTAPILERVHMPKTIYVNPAGNAIAHVEVWVRDTQSGVDWGDVYLNFKSPYQYQPGLYISAWYNKTRTHAVGTIRLNNISPSHYGNGTYQLGSASTADVLGNHWYNRSYDLLENINERIGNTGPHWHALPATNLVIDHRFDTTPPVIHSIEVHPVNLTASGGVIQVTVTVGDDRSGIDKSTLELDFAHNPSTSSNTLNPQKRLECKFPWDHRDYQPEAEDTTESDGAHPRNMFLTATCTMDVVAGTSSKNYTLQWVNVADNKGNTFFACCGYGGTNCGCDILSKLNQPLPRSKQLATLPYFNFLQTGTTDLSSPFWRSITITPETVILNNTHTNATVNVTVHVHDTVSGVAWGYNNGIEVAMFRPTRMPTSKDRFEMLLWTRLDAPRPNDPSYDTNDVLAVHQLYVSPHTFNNGTYGLEFWTLQDKLLNSWEFSTPGASPAAVLQTLNSHTPYKYPRIKKLPTLTVINNIKNEEVRVLN